MHPASKLGKKWFRLRDLVPQILDCYGFLQQRAKSPKNAGFEMLTPYLVMHYS